MIEIKVGRNAYRITEGDRFMDNGSCVQLLTQSRERMILSGFRPSPVLSKLAQKKINSFSHIQVKHDYGENVQVFKLSAELTTVGAGVEK